MPILTRDERKSKDNDDEQEENEADNDVATSAEAPPRLDGNGNNGGKNGKESAPAVLSANLSVTIIEILSDKMNCSVRFLSETPSLPWQKGWYTNRTLGNS